MERHNTIDTSFIYRCEGGDRPETFHAHWPLSASGVTIGCGYDMKDRTKEEVIKDLQLAGLTESVAARYAVAAGRRQNGVFTQGFTR